MILVGETEQQEKLLQCIENEIKNLNIKQQEFNRKKKTTISSCIYMTDSIYNLNSFVMNSLIIEKDINYNIYNHYKELDYNKYVEFANGLNFKNKSILYVNKK